MRRNPRDDSGAVATSRPAGTRGGRGYQNPEERMFAPALYTPTRWTEQGTSPSGPRRSSRNLERDVTAQAPSIHLTLVPSPAPTGPSFRPRSLCVLAQGTHGLTGKGGVGVSPRQPGTRPTCLRLEAEWAMGQGRGKVPLPIASRQGWAGTNPTRTLCPAPVPAAALLTGGRVWSGGGGEALGSGLGRSSAGGEGLVPEPSGKQG